MNDLGITIDELKITKERNIILSKFDSQTTHGISNSGTNVCTLYKQED